MLCGSFKILFNIVLCFTSNNTNTFVYLQMLLMVKSARKIKCWLADVTPSLCRKTFEKPKPDVFFTPSTKTSTDYTTYLFHVDSLLELCLEWYRCFYSITSPFQGFLILSEFTRSSIIFKLHCPIFKFITCWSISCAPSRRINNKIVLMLKL